MLVVTRAGSKFRADTTLSLAAAARASRSSSVRGVPKVLMIANSSTRGIPVGAVDVVGAAVGAVDVVGAVEVVGAVDVVGAVEGAVVGAKLAVVGAELAVGAEVGATEAVGAVEVVGADVADVGAEENAL